MSGGSAVLSLGTFSLSLSFGACVEFEFTAGSQTMSHGVIDHEVYLTHSLAVAVSAAAEFTVFADGLLLGAGTLPSAEVAADKVVISVSGGNTSVQVGNVRVSDDPEMRWPMTISALLRFRAIERAKVRRDIVDAMERRIIGADLREKLSTEDEEGVLIDEEAADPRKFVFPFKSRAQRRGSVFDTLDEFAEEADALRKVQVDEVPEDDFRTQEDEEQDEEL
jgi:hypothetical protein